MIRRRKKEDTGFILDTWLKSAKKLHMSRFVDQKEFNVGHGRIITSLVEHDQFIVACDEDDEDIIWGYVAFDPEAAIIDYVYVKELLRGHGIARNLIDATGLQGRIKATHRPNTGDNQHHVRRFKRGFSYDPYSAFRLLIKESAGGDN